MTKKRYFCDYWYGICDKYNAVPAIIIILSFFIIGALSAFIFYNGLIKHYEGDLNSYSYEHYEYLHEIADNAIIKDVGIDLSKLPEDIYEYEITKSENGNIVFKYYLDKNRNMMFAVPPSMTITLSEDYEVLTKDTGFSSKEEYIKDIKFHMIYTSLTFGFIVWILFLAVGYILCIAAAYVSLLKKHKNHS